MSDEPFSSPDFAGDDDAVMVSLWGSTAFINSLWAQYTAPQSLYETRALTQGVWETTLTRFDKVDVTWVMNVLTVAMYRRDETIVRLSEPSGIDAKQVIMVDGIKPLAGRFCVSMSEENSWIAYGNSTAGKLSVEWEDEVTYSFWNPYFALVPAAYQAHFDGLKQITLGSFPQVDSASPEKLFVSPRYDGGKLVFAVSERPLARDLIALGSQESVEDRPVADSGVVALFRSSKFPDAAAGREPPEARWFYQLVAPPGSMQVTGGKKDVAGWLTEYGLDPQRCASLSPCSTKENIESLSPHARIVRAGEARQHLSFLGASLLNASWMLTGEKRGKLEKEDYDYFYLPPVSLSPSAVFDESGESLIPASYRSSFSGLPVITDSVQVANATQIAVSTFVTTVIPPTHFFRFGTHPDGLELKLCWRSRTGERQVPPELLKWHVLSGNGTVSEQGIFIPATENPSTVTILMGEDLQDQQFWWYGVAIVPIPLFTVDEVVRLLD